MGCGCLTLDAGERSRGSALQKPPGEVRRLSCPGAKTGPPGQSPCPWAAGALGSGTREGAQLQLSSRGRTQSAASPGPPRVSMVLPCFFVPVEGLKVLEVEKCKSDIKKMREELAARSSR